MENFHPKKRPFYGLIYKDYLALRMANIWLDSGIRKSEISPNKVEKWANTMDHYEKVFSTPSSKFYGLIFPDKMETL